MLLMTSRISETDLISDIPLSSLHAALEMENPGLMLKGKNRRGLQSSNSDLACQFERPLSRKTPVELCPAACITNAMRAIATLLALPSNVPPFVHPFFGEPIRKSFYSVFADGCFYSWTIRAEKTS